MLLMNPGVLEISSLTNALLMLLLLSLLTLTHLVWLLTQRWRGTVRDVHSLRPSTTTNTRVRWGWHIWPCIWDAQTTSLDGPDRGITHNYGLLNYFITFPGNLLVPQFPHCINILPLHIVWNSVKCRVKSVLMFTIFSGTVWLLCTL